MQITISRAAAVLATTVVLAAGGVGVAAMANAGPHDDRTQTSLDCPRGYTARAVPVNGYTVWACAKPGGGQPGPTTTVTVTVTPPTVTVTEPAKTITETPKTVTSTITCAGTPQICR